METAFIVTASAWLLLFALSNGSLLLAMLTWLIQSLPQVMLPGALRTGWRMGLLALGCLLIISGIVLREAFSEYPLAGPEGFMSWSLTIAGCLTPLGTFVAATILPTSVCWFWERHARAVHQPH
jgi:hypothetical protein